MTTAIRYFAPYGARLMLGILAALSFGCGDPSTPTASTPAAPYSQTDVRTGTGTEAASGRRVSVHYSGWIFDPRQPEQKGRAFQSSLGGEPFAFVLGTGAVISGFDIGLPGMRVGGLRRLVLPSDLAYGSAGVGGVIPPYATLVFDVELIAVE
jgi:FKBP-type peptidyl-prolyl cis-trans isomerase FkpA